MLRNSTRRFFSKIPHTEIFFAIPESSDINLEIHYSKMLEMKSNLIVRITVFIKGKTQIFNLKIDSCLVPVVVETGCIVIIQLCISISPCLS